MRVEALADVLVKFEEDAGHLVGTALAPLVAAASAARGARVFHPEGTLCRAEVSELSARAPYGAIGARLVGPALVRFSAGLHLREDSRLDVLGCAIRFRRPLSGTGGTELSPAADDQDLLLVTSPSIWALPAALLTTRTSDFLANSYYGMAPFEVEGFGCGYWRVRPATASQGGEGSREKRLQASLGGAALLLELRPCGPLARYTPVAQIRLVEELSLDQEALAFSPFLAGRGIRPRGFLHAIRAATYAASQGARPRRAEESSGGRNGARESVPGRAGATAASQLHPS